MGNGVPGRGNSLCKDPEVAENLVSERESEHDKAMIIQEVLQREILEGPLKLL